MISPILSNVHPQPSLRLRKRESGTNGSFPSRSDNARPFFEEISRLSNLNVQLDRTRDIPSHLMIRAGGGSAIGVALALLTTTTGLDTALHEVVGHGLLGYKLTLNGSHPQYHVEGWENFQAMIHAPSFKEGLEEFWHLISGYNRNGDDRSGWASRGSGTTPNALGQALGPEGLSAWISLAGSIPGLLLNSLAVNGGIKLKERSPMLGYMLMSFGFMSHLLSSTYPLSIIGDSNQVLLEKASSGHDFANFAVQLSHLTGISAPTLAITTALLWTAIVPGIALITYLRQKSNASEIVSDAEALHHFLQKTKTDPKANLLLNELFAKYPQKASLIASLQGKDLQANLKNFQSKFFPFLEYLMQNLPQETLESSKKEVLQQWEKQQVPDRIQTTLSVLSLMGTISIVALKILSFLASTIFPSISEAMVICGKLSPLFLAVYVISAGYETFKDLTSSHLNVPKSAKVLSVANLIVTIAYSTIIGVTMMSPYMNELFVSTFIVATLLNVLLGYSRMRIIKHRFELLQSISPTHWEMMMGMAGCKPSGKNSEATMRKWLLDIQEAAQNELLSPAQKKQWLLHSKLLDSSKVS